MNRRWKLFVALAAFVLLAAGSAVVSLRLEPGNELEAYKKLLRDRGEKLDLAELLPPPAPSAENGAGAFQSAVSLFGTVPDNYSAMRLVGPGRAAVCWQQPDVRQGDFTNSWEQYRAYLEADRPAVDLLHQILDRPKLDFDLDYSLGARMPLQHLAPMKRAAQKLVAATQLELHDGNPGAAETNILTMLAFVQRDYRDNVLIGHLVRIAIAAMAVPSTWEFLQATNLADVQLAALQSGWQQSDYLKDAENVFTLERTWVSTEIQKYRASHENFKELSGFYRATSAGISGGPSGWGSITEGPRYAVAEAMWRSSWSYSQELENLQRNQIIVETLRAMQTNRSQFYKADCDAMSARIPALGGTNLSRGVFRAMGIPDFQDEFGSTSLAAALRKTLAAETTRRLVVTALALKRFQLQHGQWPATLAELCPALLPSVPIDPYDGKPLKYHPNDDGTYLLYSVGEDGIDDGGDAGPSSAGATGWNWLRARDLVWPQPATPAEVQYFNENPPKR
jgi:hypothetical protein